MRRAQLHGGSHMALPGKALNARIHRHILARCLTLGDNQAQGIDIRRHRPAGMVDERYAGWAMADNLPRLPLHILVRIHKIGVFRDLHGDSPLRGDLR